MLDVSSSSELKETTNEEQDSRSPLIRWKPTLCRTFQKCYLAAQGVEFGKKMGARRYFKSPCSCLRTPSVSHDERVERLGPFNDCKQRGRL